MSQSANQKRSASRLSRPALGWRYNAAMLKIALGLGVTVVLAVIIWFLFAGM
jgi:hypothetical protein